MSKVTESVARPVRGLGQGGVGYLIVDCLDEFTRWEPTTRQYGLAVLAVGSIVSFIQNTGENRGWWKAVLRTVPPTEAEVVDQVDALPQVTTTQTGRMMEANSTSGALVEYVDRHDASGRPYVVEEPVQTDNRPKPEDGEQLPENEALGTEDFTGGMR